MSRGGIDPADYSAHPLRAGFVTSPTCAAPPTGPLRIGPGPPLQSLTFTYLGGNCTDGNNCQASGESECNLVSQFTGRR